MGVSEPAVSGAFRQWLSSCCKERIHAAKAQLDLNLGRTVGDNKKSFSNILNNDRQSKDNIILLLGRMGRNSPQKLEEVINAFFASVFSMDRVP